MTDEEREAAKPTPEQRLAALEQAVKDAYSQDKRTGCVDDRVAYVKAKVELTLEREIHEEPSKV